MLKVILWILPLPFCMSNVSSRVLTSLEWPGQSQWYNPCPRFIGYSQLKYRFWTPSCLVVTFHNHVTSVSDDIIMTCLQYASSIIHEKVRLSIYSCASGEGR